MGAGGEGEKKGKAIGSLVVLNEPKVQKVNEFEFYNRLPKRHHINDLQCIYPFLLLKRNMS